EEIADRLRAKPAPNQLTEESVMSNSKRFKLHRQPFYRDDPTDKNMSITMMFDPGSAEKEVEAVSRDDLLAQMSEFGNALGRACRVTQKHLARGPGFMKLPYSVTYCESNTPNEEYGRRVCDEHLEQIRATATDCIAQNKTVDEVPAMMPEPEPEPTSDDD